MKAVESKVDWKNFHADVKALLLDLGAAHYIKEDLRAFV